MKASTKDKMSKFKRKKDRELVVHSTSLPYFNNKKVSLYTIEFGKIIIDEHKFNDVTLDGGIFYQFYTYKLKLN